MPRSSTPARIIMPIRVRFRNSQSAMPMTIEARQQHQAIDGISTHAAAGGVAP